MTKEDIKQICQIYDNFRSERDAATIAYNSVDTFWEHILANYNLSQLSLPSNLDEAAKEYAKTTFKKSHSDNPDEEVTIVEPDKYAGFIAGARYEDEQLSEKIAAAYQLGLVDKEKQMMSEAVEGWVAVDSDTYGKRRVTFFPQKPVRDVLTEYKYWAATRPRYESIKLDSNAFLSLKWEDEPKKVKLIIVKED